MRTLFTGLAVGALLLAVSLPDPADLPDDVTLGVTGAQADAPFVVHDTAIDAPALTLDLADALFVASLPAVEPSYRALATALLTASPSPHEAVPRLTHVASTLNAARARDRPR